MVCDEHMTILDSAWHPAGFGFLASKEVQDAGIGNLGLHDREYWTWPQKCSVFQLFPCRTWSIQVDPEIYWSFRWWSQQSHDVSPTNLQNVIKDHRFSLFHLAGEKVLAQFRLGITWWCESQGLYFFSLLCQFTDPWGEPYVGRYILFILRPAHHLIYNPIKESRKYGRTFPWCIHGIGFAALSWPTHRGPSLLRRDRCALQLLWRIRYPGLSQKASI